MQQISAGVENCSTIHKMAINSHILLTHQLRSGYLTFNTFNLGRCKFLAKFSTSTKWCKGLPLQRKSQYMQEFHDVLLAKRVQWPNVNFAQCKSIPSARLHIVQECLQCKSDSQSGKVAGCTSKGCRPVSQCILGRDQNREKNHRIMSFTQYCGRKVKDIFVTYCLLIGQVQTCSRISRLVVDG